MKDNVLYVKYLKNLETEEQDLELCNQFFTEEELENDYPAFIYDDGSIDYSEGDPMKIDELIEILQGLKKQDATHVEILHHQDHHSYILNSCNIRKATPDEIEKQKEAVRQKDIEFKRAKIKVMETEIKKLENEVL